MNKAAAPAGFRFGPFEVDLVEGVLRRRGTEVPIQDLPLRLLAVLAERSPSLVARDELRRALWPPDTHLDADASLNTAVARVREALGDEPGDPRFVVTVPRRGYKLAVPAEPLAARRPAPLPRTAVAAGAVLLILAAVAFAVRQGALRPTSATVPGVSESRSVAHEHLLIGRHHADRRSRDGLEKAIASFQSAVALEPDNAAAYSGLAGAYALLGIYDYWRPREAFGPAETMARRALELDPGSGEARLAMALAAAVGHWDWQTAASQLDLAMELAPNSAEVWYWRGAFLSAQGRHEEAVADTQRALALDPASPVFNAALAWRLFEARRGEDAVAQSHRATELAPGYYDAWDNLKWIQLTLGNEAEAVEAWTRADEIDYGGGEGVLEVYRARGLGGLHRESIRNQTERWEKGAYQSPYDVVLEYAALREVEAALVWLERSFGERETDLISLAVDPRLDPLRGEPRFATILAEIGIAPDRGSASLEPRRPSSLPVSRE